MTGTETISLHGVSAASLKLLDEHVLVRAASKESISASGLVIPNSARQFFGRGAEFYGVIVALGPGRLVERAPPVEAIRNVAVMAALAHFGHESRTSLAELVGEAVAEFVTKHTTCERVPLPWKVGDHVLCRQGFGPEVELREGPHHIVGRGNADHGHGVLAAWDPTHRHCWHLAARRPKTTDAAARCHCGEEGVVETRLAACSSCPPGERLAEADVAARTYEFKAGSAIGASPYELRPEIDDGRDD